MKVLGLEITREDPAASLLAARIRRITTPRKRMQPCARIIHLNVSADPIEKVRKELQPNPFCGSPLVDMAAHPDHRATVERYLEETTDRMWNARGDEAESEAWFQLGKKIATILGATTLAYEYAKANGRPYRA